MKKDIYLKSQLKKAFKLYPAIILVTLITLSSIAATCAVLLFQNTQNNEQQRVAIGVVGEGEMLQDMDRQRFYIDFINMPEEEAVKKLKSREIVGFVRIPDDFIKGIYYGYNRPAQYVMLSTPSGFGAAITGEIVDILSDLVVETQKGIYALSELERDYDLDANINQDVKDLNLSYIDFSFKRAKTYDHNVIGISDNLTFEGYYLCGITLFFLLIWGISCNKLLVGRNLSLARALKIRGLKTYWQVFCEYFAYLCVTVVTVGALAFLVGTVAQFNDFGIYELKGTTSLRALWYIVKILPAIILITIMQMMFYELVTGTVSTILVQFFIAVGLGYISGCFYPNYYFPENVQMFAAYLPTGVAFSYIRKVMSDTVGFIDFILTAGYIALFAAITLFARKLRIAGDNK